MRALFVEHKTVWGGGQVALVNVLCAWRRVGAPIQPTIVCPPDAALASQARGRGIACETFDLGVIEKTRGVAWNLAQRVGPAWRLLQTVRYTRAEIVAANGAFSFLASVFAAKLARVPIVWIEHNMTLPSDELLRRMIQWADEIVVVSETIRAQFVALAPDAVNKITVIHNGVDTANFCEDGNARMKIRAELNWDEQVRVVGTVSRLSPEKGVEFFLDAAVIVQREFPNTRFLVVGDGPLRGELEERSAVRHLSSENGIRFLGLRDDIPAVLNAMDVFVMPSFAEAFGIAVVEAMACGLPVVASDVGGLREIVLPRETGLLVPPGDEKEIARAVLELLEDELQRRACGERGRARVVEHFTVARQAERLRAIFHDARQGKGAE